ncbi:MAG: hypothetical protein LUD84_06520 [Clostridiales bacterium]|nr:hypothetical protein [Clostridiales bacterium]
MADNVERRFFQDRYNDLKVWEVVKLSHGYYLRQYINGVQFGRGSRRRKSDIADIGIFDFEELKDFQPRPQIG